jgi:peptidyl-prolyl cis-trans isomerase B (cyclophilin B)
LQSEAHHVAGSKRRAREVERARYERQQQRRAQQRTKQRRRQRIAATVASAVAVVAVVGGIVWATHHHKGSPAASPSSSVATPTTSSPSPSPSPPKTPASLVGVTAAKCATPAAGKPGTAQYKTAPTLAFPKGAKVSMTLKTTCGDIVINLNAAKAPKTVASFVTLARKGFFDHTKCHRLTYTGIYVLQCGDPTGTGTGGPGYKLPDENLPKATSGTQAIYAAGTVAMANSGPGTGGSQFFLVYQNSPLAPSYTVFGKMPAASLKVLRSIAAGKAVGGVADGAPALKVIINSVSVAGAPAAGKS